MRILEKLIELICWLWIFICPTAIFGFIGFAVYNSHKGTIGVLGSGGLSVLGAALGIFFAGRIRKTTGCTEFLTRVSPRSSGKKDKK